MTELFDKMLELSGWTEEDGMVEGVFRSRPPGSICLWSVKWSTALQDRVVTPDDLIRACDLNNGQVLYELMDLKEHGISPFSDQAAHELLEFDKKNITGWAGGARHLLQRARIAYPEFVFPYYPPPRNKLMIMTLRPFWEHNKADEVFAKAVELTRVTE